MQNCYTKEAAADSLGRSLRWLDKHLAKAIKLGINCKQDRVGNDRVLIDLEMFLIEYLKVHYARDWDWVSWDEVAAKANEKQVRQGVQTPHNEHAQRAEPHMKGTEQRAEPSGPRLGPEEYIDVEPVSDQKQMAGVEKLKEAMIQPVTALEKSHQEQVVLYVNQIGRHEKQLDRQSRIFAWLVPVLIVLTVGVGIAIWQWSNQKTLAEVKGGDLAAAKVELIAGRKKAEALTTEVGGLTGKIEILTEQAAQNTVRQKSDADQMAELNKSLGTAGAETRAAMNQVEALTAELEKMKALNETVIGLTADPNVN